MTVLTKTQLKEYVAEKASDLIREAEEAFSQTFPRRQDVTNHLDSLAEPTERIYYALENLVNKLSMAPGPQAKRWKKIATEAFRSIAIIKQEQEQALADFDAGR